MKLFKNGVGRPSNDIIRKRKKIVFIFAFFVIIIITTLIYGNVKLNEAKGSSNTSGSANISILKKMQDDSVRRTIKFFRSWNKNITGNNAYDKCVSYAKNLTGNDSLTYSDKKYVKDYKSFWEQVNYQIALGKPVMVAIHQKNTNKIINYLLVYEYDRNKKYSSYGHLGIDPEKKSFVNLGSYNGSKNLINKDKNFTYRVMRGNHKNASKTNYGSVGMYGKFQLYKQGFYSNPDFYKYWNDTIATDGCLPTSVAIILSGFGIYETPDVVAEFGGAWNGTYDYATKYLKKRLGNNYSIVGKEATLSNSDFVNYIKQGYKSIVWVNDGKIGDKFYHGHFYAVIDYNKNKDKLYVADPGPTSMNNNYNGWYKVGELTKKMYFILIKKK